MELVIKNKKWLNQWLKDHQKMTSQKHNMMVKHAKRNFSLKLSATKPLALIAINLIIFHEIHIMLELKTRSSLKDIFKIFESYPSMENWEFVLEIKKNPISTNCFIFVGHYIDKFINIKLAKSLKKCLQRLCC